MRTLIILIAVLCVGLLGMVGYRMFPAKDLTQALHHPLHQPEWTEWTIDPSAACKMTDLTFSTPMVTPTTQAVFADGDITLTPRKEYVATGRVMAINRHDDPAATTAAQQHLTTVIIGFNVMSDYGCKRFFHPDKTGSASFTFQDNPPYDGHLIAHSLAYDHILPANALAVEGLAELREGDAVEIRGYLVDVTQPDASWKTSLNVSNMTGGLIGWVWATSVRLRHPD